jgi:hypothetical protein
MTFVSIARNDLRSKIGVLPAHRTLSSVTICPCFTFYINTHDTLNAGKRFHFGTT